MDIARFFEYQKANSPTLFLLQLRKEHPRSKPSQSLTHAQEAFGHPKRFSFIEKPYPNALVMVYEAFNVVFVPFPFTDSDQSKKDQPLCCQKIPILCIPARKLLVCG